MARSTLEGKRANLENQRANLAKARAVADNDARQAERMKTLFERGLVSATDWENARTNAESSRASVQAAEAQLRLAEVQIATAGEPGAPGPGAGRDLPRRAHARRDQPRQHAALAPFAGYVAQRNLDPGAAVSAQSAGTNTTSVGILAVQDIETREGADRGAGAGHRPRARWARRVRLTVDPYQGEVFTGTVARVVHNLDPRTRTMGIEVEIPNPGGRLKPGMFARVEVLVETRQGALTSRWRRSAWARPSPP